MAIFYDPKRIMLEISRTKSDGTTDKPEDDDNYMQPQDDNNADPTDTQDQNTDQPTDDQPQNDDDTDSPDQIDYTVDGDEEPGTDDGSDEDFNIPDDEPTADDGVDYTDDNPDDDGEDNDEPTADDGVDYTADNDEGEPSADDGVDYTDDNDEGDEPAADDGEPSADDGVDYTDDNPDDDGTDPEQDDTTLDGDDENQAGLNAEIKALEDQIYNELSPEQIAIRNKELKNLFGNMYDTTVDIATKLNNVVKTPDNIKVLEFISEKIFELKDLIHFTLTEAFPTKTYIENMTIYTQCLGMLNTINDLLESIATKPEE